MAKAKLVSNKSLQMVNIIKEQTLPYKYCTPYCTIFLVVSFQETSYLKLHRAQKLFGNLG